MVLQGFPPSFVLMLSFDINLVFCCYSWYDLQLKIVLPFKVLLLDLSLFMRMPLNINSASHGNERNTPWCLSTLICSK